MIETLFTMTNDKINYMIKQNLIHTLLQFKKFRCFHVNLLVILYCNISHNHDQKGEFLHYKKIQNTKKGLNSGWSEPIQTIVSTLQDMPQGPTIDVKSVCYMQ